MTRKQASLYAKNNHVKWVIIKTLRNGLNKNGTPRLSKWYVFVEKVPANKVVLQTTHKVSKSSVKEVMQGREK